jgi:hypothetical protein
MSFDYMSEPKVKSYYDKWAATVKTPTPVIERESFYKFAKACLEVDKAPSLDTLKGHLYDDFHERPDFDDFQSETIILFETLVKFYNVRLS